MVRADAGENRARILAAARAELATTAEPRLNAIAKAAGVGQGTLYRHFPIREDLLAAVYRAEVEELAAAAPALLAAHPPLEALTRWFTRVADYARVKVGVLAAVEAGVGRDLTDASRGPIGDAVAALLVAGVVAGELRDDVDARDAVLLIGFLGRSAGDGPRARRLLRVVLDGLRA